MRFRAFALAALLAAFVIASPVGAQSIVGAWFNGNPGAEGTSVIVFLPSGFYFQIQNARPDEAPHGFDGFERGTYTWDAATGAFAVTVLQDLNGDTGLSNLVGVAGATLTIFGDTATARIPGGSGVTVTRVMGASPLVGAWIGGDPAVANNAGVLVFLPNDVYFMAEDGDSSPTTGDPSGHDGVEIGTYSWNPVTGSIATRQSPAPWTDTTGQWGLSNIPVGSTVTVSADRTSLALYDGAGATFLSRVDTTPVNVDSVVEYHHAEFDHYFITASADEVAKLDAGVFVGWSRTGKTFRNYALDTPGTANVCRFFSTSFAPKSSHFYTPSAAECAIVKANPDWLYEDVVFAVGLPDAAGACAGGTLPLYRLYNNGQGAAPNHRYTTSVVVRAAMIGAGWIPEGNGADGVIGCVPV